MLYDQDESAGAVGVMKRKRGNAISRHRSRAKSDNFFFTFCVFLLEIARM